MAKNKPKIRKIAKILFEEAHQTIREIVYLTDYCKMTVHRWKQEDKWGEGVDISLDSIVEDTQTNLACTMRFLRNRITQNEFEGITALSAACKRFAEINSTLTDDAPFHSQKQILEGLDAFRFWLDKRYTNLELPIKKTILEEIDTFYREIMGSDETSDKA